VGAIGTQEEEEGGGKSERRVAEGRRKLRSNELYVLYLSLDIITMIKLTVSGLSS
jgi:hypothetical protein